jgi:F-type H+-transporting ATPase subunit gamma
MGSNVRALKGRIANIENIQQITRAMHAIAMTKVTRMKPRLTAATPYLKELGTFISALLAQLPEGAPPHPLTTGDSSRQVGVLILNADRGLCGRFKGDLNKKGEELLARFAPSGAILVGGEKARSHFARKRVEMLKIYTHLYENPTPEIARQMAADLIALRSEGTLGQVFLITMQFLSDLAQRVVVEEIVPIHIEPQGGEMLVEPDPASMLAVALPFYLQSKLFSALLHTKTSEAAIRRQAMKNATDNADDLVKALTRSYHKARQQAITREIADIMGGAEAVRRR